MKILLAAILLAAGLGAPTIAAAQAETTPPAAAAPAQPAAFMKPLGRLSGILGSVHYLRKLCGADDASAWRDRMNELLMTQQPSDVERRALVAQFNNGYRTFESTYRRCTPSAELAIERFLAEGETLATEIASRYGN